MPLYEYRCLKCKRHTEKIENLNGPHLKKCPHCGGKMESVITAPAINSREPAGSTDYGRKGSGGDAAKSEKGEKSEKSEKSDKPESKPAASAKEQKKSASSSKEK